MKSAYHNRYAGGTERAGNVEGARILVRLYTNQRNQPEVAVATKPLEQFRHIDARVRLINCLDGDRNIRSENLALCAIRRNAVHGGQRIRRNYCAPPAYYVAIVVIVRRFDQNELEALLHGHTDLQI